MFILIWEVTYMEKFTEDEINMAENFTPIILQSALNWSDEDTEFYSEAYDHFDFFYEENSKLLQEYLNNADADNEFEGDTLSGVLTKVALIFTISMIRRAKTVEKDHQIFISFVYASIAVLANYKDFYDDMLDDENE